MFDPSPDSIIDISLPLNPQTPVYPNNPPVEFSTVSSTTSIHTIITLGSHTGTHIDAPRHISAESTIDHLPLSAFIGPARVLDCTHESTSVSLETIKRATPQPHQRILLKTQNSHQPFTNFDPSYIFLSPQASTYLANLPVALIGIDALSIKQKGSLDTTPHTAFLDKNIPIIEGLNLASVPAGDYTLLAAPLKFTGIDGAPTRALLIKP